jgi:hypothetical protein
LKAGLETAAATKLKDNVYISTFGDLRLLLIALVL